jgi:Tol biopolymer transport system component
MKNFTANTYRHLSALALMMLGLLLWLPVQVEAGTIQRISVNNNGEEANGESSEPFISDNGRFVVFASTASNLVEGDINNKTDIFVYDLLENKIERISVDSNGDGNIDNSSNPSISGDGRYVAFYSSYNRSGDLLVYDRQENFYRKIFERTSGGDFTISANGKYIVFTTPTILVEGISDDYTYKIYLHNLDSGTTKFVSFSAGTSNHISNDGHFIVFISEARMLDVESTDEFRRDVFVHDRTANNIVRISLGSQEKEPNGYSSGPKMSSDGRYVVFKSNADNLVKDDNNGKPDLFVHDTQKNITTKISDEYSGAEYIISGNGAYVVFYSYETARKLKGYISGQGNMVVHNLQTNEKHWLPMLITNEHLSISRDGRYIAFRSQSSDLVENDTNGKNDIFVYDRGAGSIVTISGNIHSSDNQPLADIALCIDGIDNCETSTDATGNFTLTRELRNSLYLITPQQTETSGALKFTPQSRWLNVTGKPIENINFIATPYDPNPHIYVSTNAMQFSTENPNIDVDIRMDFEGDEPIEKFYDVYVVVGAVGAPIEAMLFHDGQTGFQNTLTPYVENKRITPTDDKWETIFTYFFDKNVPAGDYFVHVGLVDKDNGELIAEDRVEVNYAPEPKPLYVVEQGVARIPAPKPELPSNPELTINAELETYLKEKKGNSEEATKFVKLGADASLDMMIATLDHRGLKMFKRANVILNDIAGAGIAYMDYDAAASTGEINTHQRDMLFGVYVLGKLLEKASLYSVDPKDLADSIKRIFVASNEHKRTLASVATGGGVSFPTNFKFGHLGFFKIFQQTRELKVKLNTLIIFDDDLETPKKIMSENNLKDMYVCTFKVDSDGYKFGIMLPDPGLYLVTAEDQTTSQVRRQTIIIDGADVSVQFDYSKTGTGEWDYEDVPECRY